MSSVPAPCWRSIASDAIVWHEWGEEFVVRNERSGSTHLLGALAGTVLQVLLEADHPLSIADIATRLDNQLATPADSTLLAAIHEVLVEFDRLELAEQVRQ